MKDIQQLPVGETKPHAHTTSKGILLCPSLPSDWSFNML